MLLCNNDHNLFKNLNIVKNYHKNTDITMFLPLRLLISKFALNLKLTTLNLFCWTNICDIEGTFEIRQKHCEYVC